MQLMIAEVLSDSSWVDSYLEFSNAQLRKCYLAVTSTLQKINVPYVEAKAGMFVWADFSSCLLEDTWEAEEAFTRACFENAGALLFGDAPGSLGFSSFYFFFPLSLTIIIARSSF